ncbi:hypothetical protein BC833DRAFT_621337 [Globomyces pollinis-pini]|nr:hypothetical protein BC833DRAFT_621337 [Globomyces pollinis-pini]
MDVVGLSASKYYLSSIGHAKNSLREVIFSVAFRIAVAMLGFLISAIFALTGVWGMAFEIQFSFENYCAIVASTYAIKKDGTASDQQNSTTKKSMVSKA